MPALGALVLLDVVWWLGVLIFCFLCLKIAQALLGTASGLVGWIPFVGGWTSHKIEDVARKIAHVMAGGMGYADQRVAAAIHDLARLTDWIGRELASHANILLRVAEAITGTLPAGYLLKELHLLKQAGHAAEQVARGIGNDVLPRIQTVERGIGADVLPHIRALDRELGRIEAKTIPGIRGEVRGIEHGATGLWRWVLRHPRTVASTAFAGAVAWALSHLGVNWIRCNNWKRIGKGVCGTPAGDIEALLGLVVAGVAVLEFRELVKVAQSVEKATATGIKDLLQV